MRLSRIAIPALVPAFLAVAILARAEDKKEDPPNIEVRVLSILASEHHTEIQKKLTQFAEEVRKTDKKLTGFRLDRTSTESIPLGETRKLKLTDDQIVEVTANKPKDEKGRITLTIKPPKLTEITYECVCDKYVSMATNYHVGKDKEKQQLFIAVMAKPCGLKKKE